MRHLGLWTLWNLPSIGVGQRLAGVVETTLTLIKEASQRLYTMVTP